VIVHTLVNMFDGHPVEGHIIVALCLSVCLSVCLAFPCLPLIHEQNALFLCLPPAGLACGHYRAEALLNLGPVIILIIIHYLPSCIMSTLKMNLRYDADLLVS